MTRYTREQIQSMRNDYSSPNVCTPNQKTIVKLCDQLLITLPASDGKVRPEGWQPIETAPKDGTWIILFSSVEGVVPGYWGPTYFDYDEKWIQYSHRTDYQDIEGDITHWMPLPTYPSVKEDKAK